MSRTCANGCGYAQSCPGPVQTVAVMHDHFQDLCKRLWLRTIMSRTCANGCGYARSFPGPVQTVVVTHNHVQDLCKRLPLLTLMFYATCPTMCACVFASAAHSSALNSLNMHSSCQDLRTNAVPLQATLISDLSCKQLFHQSNQSG